MGRPGLEACLRLAGAYPEFPSRVFYSNVAPVVTSRFTHSGAPWGAGDGWSGLCPRCRPEAQGPRVCFENEELEKKGRSWLWGPGPKSQCFVTGAGQLRESKPCQP